MKNTIRRPAKRFLLRIASFVTAVCVLTPCALAREDVPMDVSPASPAYVSTEEERPPIPSLSPAPENFSVSEAVPGNDSPVSQAAPEMDAWEVLPPDDSPVSNVDAPEISPVSDPAAPQSDTTVDASQSNTAASQSDTDTPEFDGYIVTLDTGPRLLTADDLPALDEIYAPDGIYQADTLEDVERLEEIGLLISVEPDYIVTLDDDFPMPNEYFPAPDDDFPAPDDDFPAPDDDFVMLSGDDASSGETPSPDDTAPDDTNNTPDDTDDTTDDTISEVEIQWFDTVLGLDYVRAHAVRGERVRVGVVDSGIFDAHEDFAGSHIIPGHNYSVTENDVSWDDTSDSYGHGTFVSGLIAATVGNAMGIAGISPDVELVPLKCFDGKSSRISGIARAIYAGVDDYHCQVLNLSFGTATESGALRNAVRHAAAEGVIMAAAAGNLAGGNHSPKGDPLNYPAAWAEVIGTGAVEQAQQNGETVIRASEFSYRNEGVWITAPGNGVRSLNYTGGYRSSYGTSYAAPMVTAAAALTLSIRPSLTRTEFVELLHKTALDLGDPGYDTTYGYGLLQVGTLIAVLAEENWASLTGQIHSLTELYDASDMPLFLLGTYDSNGRMLTVQNVSDGTQPRQEDRAREWKLFTLEPDTLCPIQSDVEIIGAAWPEEESPPDNPDDPNPPDNPDDPNPPDNPGPSDDDETELLPL